MFPALQEDSLTTVPRGKPRNIALDYVKDFPNFKPLIKPACNKFYSDLKYLLLCHGRQPNFPAMLVAELTMQLTLSFKVGFHLSVH